MDRDKAIKIIETLYPADADWPQTASIGRQLLDQAKGEINNWRNEPTNVLIRYAGLCADYEREAMRKSEKKWQS